MITEGIIKKVISQFDSLQWLYADCSFYHTFVLYDKIYQMNIYIKFRKQSADNYLFSARYHVNNATRLWLRASYWLKLILVKLQEILLSEPTTRLKMVTSDIKLNMDADMAIDPEMECKKRGVAKWIKQIELVHTYRLLFALIPSYLYFSTFNCAVTKSEKTMMFLASLLSPIGFLWIISGYIAMMVDEAKDTIWLSKSICDLKENIDTV